MTTQERTEQPQATTPAVDAQTDVPYALRLEDVVKRFGEVTAVNGVSLDVAEGEFLTILGPSGSGKTTLLRLVAGFQAATSGVIRLGDRDVSTVPPGKRDIGMVFQNYALFPHMTVLDNVAYGLKVRGKRKPDRVARAHEVLEMVGLGGYHARMPRELSGGQQQRVAVARAIAFEPTMLLMDEPLGALDRELRVRMAGELRRLHEQLGNTVLYVTHDREEALTLSDRIAVMRMAELEAVGKPQDLFGRPETRFVASFFGGHNCLPCEVVGHGADGTADVRCLGQALTVHRSPRLEAGAKESCLVVPGDALEFADAGNDAGAEATVHSAVYMGNQIQVLCDIDGIEEPLRVDVPGGMAVPPHVGTRVRVVIRAAHTTVVPAA